MTFKEYLEKNEKAIKNMHVENIDELKKFADKEKIVYSDEELKQAWSHIKNQNASGNGALDEDVLNAVAGGGLFSSSKKTTTTNINDITNITDDHSDHSTTIKWVDTGGGSIYGGVNF